MGANMIEIDKIIENEKEIADKIHKLDETLKISELERNQKYLFSLIILELFLVLLLMMNVFKWMH